MKTLPDWLCKLPIFKVALSTYSKWQKKLAYRWTGTIEAQSSIGLRVEQNIEGWVMYIRAGFASCETNTMLGILAYDEQEDYWFIDRRSYQTVDFLIPDGYGINYGNAAIFYILNYNKKDIEAEFCMYGILEQL